MRNGLLYLTAMGTGFRKTKGLILKNAEDSAASLHWITTKSKAMRIT